MSTHKIGLISPKSSFNFKDKEKNKILNSLPGFEFNLISWSGLGTALPILASLTDNNFEVEIIDENIESINFESDYTLVGVTAMTQQAIRAYQICGEFRKRGIVTVIGGIHASIMHEEASIYADTVVIGEAETIWPQLLKDFTLGKLKKKYFYSDYPAVDLTALPIPRYDLLANKNYKILWVNSSRGCPYNCDFCSVTNFFGKKIRHKLIPQIGQEIISIKKHFPQCIINFGTDNMFIDQKFSKELVNSFNNYYIKWQAQTDISIGEDSEFLKLLYQSGCQTLFIGFESLKEINLEHIYTGTSRKLKRDYLTRYKQMVENIQSHGIKIIGAFIIGLEYDTVDSFKEIVDFAVETRLATVQISILTPLPGTHLRERLINEKAILPTSWDNYTFSDLNIIHNKMTYQEIEEGIMNAYRQIYNPENRILKFTYFKKIAKKLFNDNQKNNNK